MAEQAPGNKVHKTQPPNDVGWLDDEALAALSSEGAPYSTDLNLAAENEIAQADSIIRTITGGTAEFVLDNALTQRDVLLTLASVTSGTLEATLEQLKQQGKFRFLPSRERTALINNIAAAIERLSEAARRLEEAVSNPARVLKPDGAEIETHKPSPTSEATQPKQTPRKRHVGEPSPPTLSRVLVERETGRTFATDKLPIERSGPDTVRPEDQGLYRALQEMGRNNAEALDPVDGKEHRAGRVEELIREGMRHIANPDAIKEVRKIAPALIEARRQIKTMTDEEVGNALEEALDALEAGRLETLAPTNPFAALQLLNSATYSQALFDKMAAELEPIPTPKYIRFTKNAWHDVWFMTGIATILGANWLSWTLTSGTFKTLTHQGTPHIPVVKDALPYIAAVIQKYLGVSPIQQGEVASNIAGLGGSGYISYVISTLRGKTGRTWRELVQLVVAMGISSGGALGTLAEKTYEAGVLSDTAEDMVTATKSFATKAQQLDMQVKAVTTSISESISGEIRAQTDVSKGGCGQICGVMSLVGGEPLDHVLQKIKIVSKSGGGELTEFSEKHRVFVQKHAETIAKIMTDPKYKALGIEIGTGAEGKKVGDVIKQIFAGASAKAAIDLFNNLEARAKRAASATPEGQMWDTVNPANLLAGGADSVDRLTATANEMAGAFKSFFDEWNKLEQGQLKLLRDLIEEVADKTGIKEVRALSSILHVPGLGMSYADIETGLKSVKPRTTQNVFQIITTKEGMDEMRKSLLRSNLLPHDLDTAGKILFGIYLLVDFAPAGIVYKTNSSRAMRFGNEFNARWSEVNETEEMIAAAIAKNVRGAFGASKGILNLEAQGLAYELPDGVLEAQIRRKIRERAAREIPGTTPEGDQRGYIKRQLDYVASGRGARGAAGQLLGPTRNFLANFAGIESPTEEIETMNAYRDYLLNLKRTLLQERGGNDPTTLYTLTESIYPHFKIMNDALSRSLLNERGSASFAEIETTLRDAAVEIRKTQYEAAAQDLPIQLALLQRTNPAIDPYRDPLTGTKVLSRHSTLLYNPEDINAMLIYPQIQQDTLALQRSLEQLRTQGVAVSPVVADKIDAALGEAVSIDWSPEQASTHTLTNHYRRHIENLTGKNIEGDGLKEFNAYMNTLKAEAVKLLDGMKAKIDGNLDASPILKNRNWTLVHEASPEDGTPTFVMKVVDPETESVIASVPFTAHPIPDFQGARSIEETATALAEWMTAATMVEERPDELPFAAAMYSAEIQLMLHETIGHAGTEGSPSGTKASLTQTEQRFKDEHGAFELPLEKLDAHTLEQAAHITLLRESAHALHATDKRVRTTGALTDATLEEAREWYHLGLIADSRAVREVDRLTKIIEQVRKLAPADATLSLDLREGRGLLLTTPGSSNELCIPILYTEPGYAITLEIEKWQAKQPTNAGGAV